MGEWINCGYIQTVGYPSALIRNELSSHEKAWRDLKCILVVKEANLKILHTRRYSGKDKIMEAVKRLVVARSQDGGGER